MAVYHLIILMLTLLSMNFILLMILLLPPMTMITMVFNVIADVYEISDFSIVLFKLLSSVGVLLRE